MVQMDPQPLLFEEVTARKRAPEVRPVSGLMQLFTLLVRKELLLKLRRPLITLFEIIFPAGLCAILIAGSRASQTNYYNATGFAPANFSAAVGSLGPQVLGPVLLSGEAQSTGANAGGLPSIPVPGAVPPLGVFLLYANVFSLCSPGQVRRSDPLTPSPRRPAPTPLHARLRCSWRRPTAPSSPWRPTRRRPVRWPRRCSRTPTCTASYCAPTPTTLHLAPPRPPPPSRAPPRAGGRTSRRPSTRIRPSTPSGSALPTSPSHCTSTTPTTSASRSSSSTSTSTPLTCATTLTRYCCKPYTTPVSKAQCEKQLDAKLPAALTDLLPRRDQIAPPAAAPRRAPPAD